MVSYGRLIGAYPDQEGLAEVAFTPLTIILHHKDFVIIFILCVCYFVPRVGFLFVVTELQI